jgi:SAM-dependent methyltransferase
VAAASAEGGEVIGVDIAFRWLVVGRRRLDELGRGAHVRLVCACADHLPFPDQSFDLVVAENLIEHTRRPEAVLVEAGRVRRAGGAFMARTVNRYAAAPEPHVGVWGVGFLPRRLMDPYVRWRKGLPYQHIQLQSYFDLRRILRASGQADLRVRRPHLARADYQHHASRTQRLFEWYAALDARLPLARPLLTLFGPYLDIVSQPAIR